MDCMKLKDLALVFNELLLIDSECQFMLEGDVIQVWSAHKEFVPSSLSKDALVAMVQYEWTWREGIDDFNFYFE